MTEQILTNYHLSLKSYILLKVYLTNVGNSLILSDRIKENNEILLKRISNLDKKSMYIQFAPNQMNKPGRFVEFYTGPAYSSGLAQTVHLESNIKIHIYFISLYKYLTHLRFIIVVCYIYTYTYTYMSHV